MKIYKIIIEVEDHKAKLYEWEIADAIQKVIKLAKYDIKVMYSNPERLDKT